VTPVRALAVVVPARDEERLLPACLDSIEASAAALRRARPDVPVRIFVVLDACRDGSAEVVRSHPGVVAVATLAGCVGVARATGVDEAARWRSASGAPSLWVASTDADSVVPPHWLTAHLRWAEEGLGLVVGTVVPRPDDLSPEVLAAWEERHSTADGHEHVHGANLGFSLDAYRAAGGFPPLPVHEDVDLVTAMRAAGVPHLATGTIPVVTSGRRDSRTPGGFAHYLDDLDDLGA
jgi:hypothetical protein